MKAKKRNSVSPRKGSKKSKRGTLIIVGGAEDKIGDLFILKEIARRAGSGKLIVATLASEFPEEVWDEYHTIFKALGVRTISHLSITQPDEARHLNVDSLFKDATVLFFSGGDQLKITTKIGGSPIMDQIFRLYESGGTIAGTSAGAAVMGKTMLVGREVTESHKVGNWMMAPGAGLLENMIIDQHFAQRSRIGRLLGAVSLNPGVIGIGIDENTAIIVEGDCFRVLGENAVYIIDGTEVSFTNISEASAEKTMSIHDVKLHILAEPEGFDLVTRRPSFTGLEDRIPG